MEGIIEAARSTTYQIKLRMEGATAEVALWKRRFGSKGDCGKNAVQQALLDASGPSIPVPVLAPGVSVVLAKDTTNTSQATIFRVLSLRVPCSRAESPQDTDRMRGYTNAVSAWVSSASRDLLSRAEWRLVPAHVRREMMEVTGDRGSGEAADIVREALTLLRSAVDRVNIRTTLEQDLPVGHGVCSGELDTLAIAIDCYKGFRRDPFSTELSTQFRTLDTFARAYGLPASARGVAAVAFRLKSALTEGGHACCSLTCLMASPLLDWDSEDVRAHVVEGVRTGVLVAHGEDIYLRRVHRIETGVGERFRLLLRTKAHGSAWSSPARKSAIRAVLEEERGLDPIQHSAVLKTLTGDQGVMVVSGYPGTGKSRVSRALLDTCRRVGLTVIACAPTAKAASRLGGGASTVHRALGAVPGRPLVSKLLDADLVLVDEVSMLDMNVAHALLTACDPDRTRIVLVGDSHQLPSVEWGDLLGSLMETTRVPRVFLETVYRQTGSGSSSTIWALAKSIADGGPLLRSDLRSETVTWVAESSLSEVSASLLRLREEHGDRMQIISPSRRHGLHTGVLNAIVLGRPVSTGFQAGDRVVITQNQKTLMNGDCGVVLSVSNRGVSVRTDDGRSGFLQSCDVDHSYALTIHKAQGSEYPVVALVLSAQQGRALNRQALYTAVSRAEDRLYVFASRETLGTCVTNLGTRRRGNLRGWIDDIDDAGSR